MTEFRVFGPPGTGKTNFLATKAIPAAVEKYGSDRVVVTSFTKAAAAEIAGKGLDVDSKNVGTLHKICYHMLNRPPLTEKCLKDWNLENPEFSFNGTTDDKIESIGGNSGLSFGAKLMAKMDVLRNRETNPSVWPTDVQSFYRRWTKFKAKTGTKDFTDLIEECTLTGGTFENPPKAMFVDEAQDFTPLELKLVRRWGERMDWFTLVGDDDQCQPGGTMVLTTKGYKEMRSINPITDKLATYDQTAASVYTGKGNGGYGFRINRRFSDGNIFEISTASKKTVATANHIWLVKWSDAAKNAQNVISYLMEKDGNFRIGWCQLIRADGCFHPAVRMNLEAADNLWILNVHKNKKDASIEESFFSAQYGITTAPFVPHGGTVLYDKESLNDLFENKLNKKEQCFRAIALLKMQGRDIRYPFWSKRYARTRQGGKSILHVRSCNLIPELMEIPEHIAGKAVQWKPVSVSKYKNAGTVVYSLDVEKHHTYIADGLVTHNCIYGFTGATPKAFLEPPIDAKHKRILAQSYRVPRAVHRRAMSMIKRVLRREIKDYLPRDEEGIVRERHDSYKRPEDMVFEAEQKTKEGKSVMIIASCDYMLTRIISTMRSLGIPFGNKYKASHIPWNPLVSGKGKKVMARDLLVSFIEEGIDGPYWNVPQLLKWIDYIGVDEHAGIIPRSGKKVIKKLKEAVGENAKGLHTSRNVIGSILSESAINAALNRDLKWFQNMLLNSRKNGMEYPLKVYQRYNKDISYLKQTPKITVGTIHSVKGGQSDCVYLFPDISYSALEEITGTVDARDALHRLFYVGMTRAKYELCLMNPAVKRKNGRSNGLFVDF